ncbi:MAG: hypothetical protein LBH29_05105, partial [Elusimicrobiota bacterium]|nr:hypothetical protein [Elusimicrobiota bacterium]
MSGKEIKKDIFPKSIPALNEVEKSIREQWAQFWLENITSQRGGGIIENFNHKEPLKSFRELISG